MSSYKCVLGIIAGASIGAMAGLLFAPDKGAVTRKKIIDQTNDLRSMMNDWATGFIEDIKNGSGSSQPGNSGQQTGMTGNLNQGAVG